MLGFALILSIHYKAAIMTIEEGKKKMDDSQQISKCGELEFKTHKKYTKEYDFECTKHLCLRKCILDSSRSTTELTKTAINRL